MKLGLLCTLLLLFSIKVVSQTTMTYYRPESKEYGIYYPKHYIVKADKSETVSFMDPEGNIDITLSSYFFENKTETGKLILKLSEFTGIKREDFANYKSKFDDLFEGRIKKDDDYWTWWCIMKDNHAIVISINKSTEITDGDINMVRYMIQNLDM
ncbi:hypothetical protein DEU42_11528 [Flavobacterium sp. AG291]|nr:hypothetical protein DEU42_11528 [Flavobacterium sp. AG291]